MSARVVVMGDRARAWLAACTLARFLVEPGDVGVVPVSGEAGGEWVLRPEMEKLHRSLGLDVAALPGARPVGTYPVHRRAIPLSGFGAPLDAVAFQHLWVRSRAWGDTRDLWAFNRLDAESGLLSVGAGIYAEALEAIARTAGVQECPDAEGAELVVRVGASAPARGSDGDHLVLSFAAPGCASGGGLAPLRLHLSLKALIRHGLGQGSASPERRALQRRLSALDRHMETFCNLLGEAPDTGSHRAAAWRELGRILPVDGDPFTAPEWIAAMLYAGVVPEGYHRLADRFTRGEIEAHLEACVARRPQHA